MRVMTPGAAVVCWGRRVNGLLPPQEPTAGGEREDAGDVGRPEAAQCHHAAVEERLEPPKRSPDRFLVRIGS